MKQLLATTSTHKSPLLAMLILADILFFMLSDPLHLPFVVMIIGWLLVGASIYYCCYYGRLWFKRAKLIKRQHGLNIVLLSGFIYIVVVLQAVGQLSLRDIAALVPLVIIGYLYFRRAKVQKAVI